MSTPTLCLSLLVLLSTAFPGQALRLAAWPARWREVGFAGPLAVVALLAYLVVPGEPPTLVPVDSSWFALAVLVGLAAPNAEYVVGALLLALRGRRPGGLAVHAQAGSGLVAVLSGLVAACAEEALLRGLAIPLLGSLGLLTGTAIGVTAVVYGLNHLYFGWPAVAQKTLTGVAYGLLFVWSGGLLVPVTAHAVQNLVVLLVLPRSR